MHCSVGLGDLAAHQFDSFKDRWVSYPKLFDLVAMRVSREVAGLRCLEVVSRGVRRCLIHPWLNGCPHLDDMASGLANAGLSRDNLLYFAPLASG